MPNSETRQGLLGRVGQPDGAQTLMALWLALPLLGKPVALMFLVFLPLRRDRHGPMLPSLFWFAVLCAVYAVYICLRTILAGPGLTEPLIDVIPLVVVTALAAWTVRQPEHMDLGRLYKAACSVLLVVFVAALFERTVLGIWRPQLLLGNPLNLTSVLLLLALFVTMDRYAPSRFWLWLGLLAFGCAGYVIGGLSQSRGLFLGLGVLLAVRILFGLWEGQTLREKAGRAGRLLAIWLLTVWFVASDYALSNRYLAMTQTLTSSEAPPEWSTGLRVMMLQGGLAAAAERPLVGHGPQFRTSAAIANVPDWPAGNMTHLHNDYLTHFVAGGVPALLLLLAIIATPAITGWSGNQRLPAKDRLSAREIGTLATLTFAGIAAVNNILFVDISAFSTGLGIAATLILLASQQRAQPRGLE